MDRYREEIKELDKKAAKTAKADNPINNDG